METREIFYEFNGESRQARVQMLSPGAGIFLVSCGAGDPIHLEYSEDGWDAIEDGQNIALVYSIGEALMKTFGKMLSRTIVPDEQFFIVANEGEEIICSWETDLRIRVTGSTESLGLGDSAEQVYFGTYGESFRAFQTIDFRREDSELIEQAIAWYTSRKTDAGAARPHLAVSLN